MKVPLYSRDGAVIAWALIDDDDSWAADHEWQLRSGYASRCENGQTVFLHREILGLPRVRRDRVVGDHINRDPLDNRRANLRAITHAEDKQNRRAWGRGSSHRGVNRSRDKWTAQVQVAGVRHYLGQFDSEGEAAHAASDFRAEHMPYSDEAVSRKKSRDGRIGQN